MTVTKTEKHTPGPWRSTRDFVDPVPVNRYRVADGSGEFHSIAQCFGPSAEANAHLIAAAPTMKEAIETAIAHRERIPIHMCPGSDCAVCNEVWGVLHEAIAVTEAK